MYQKTDAGFIDYQQHRFGSTKSLMRGPLEPIGKPYIVCLGAAQTFGRFVERPFPRLLQERLGVRCVNLGAAGGGPDLFLADKEILALCAGAEACVLQVMSGRSINNAFYSVEQRRNAIIKYFAPELRDVIWDMRQKGRKLMAHDVLLKIRQKKNPQLTQRVFGEVRRAWVEAYWRLLSDIRTYSILFWFSERTPDSKEAYEHQGKWMKFPQMVDKSMIDAVRPRADAYIECISSAGLPQSLLRNGKSVVFTEKGAPKDENPYYPSPEMHALAADALLEPLRKALSANSRRQDG